MALIKAVKLDLSGQPTDHPVLYYPCIQISYSFSEPLQKESGDGYEIPNIQKCWGLVDTGADWNLIDQSLIPPSAREIQLVTNSGVSGSVTTKNYHITFNIPEASMAQTTSIISWKKEGNEPYSIILGRKFLQNCHMVFDRHHGIVSLDWNENPKAI